MGQSNISHCIQIHTSEAWSSNVPFTGELQVQRLCARISPHLTHAYNVDIFVVSYHLLDEDARTPHAYMVHATFCSSDRIAFRKADLALN